MIGKAFRNGCQRGNILREARAPVANACVEIERADPFVEPHPLRDQLGVRADPLADPCDLVDE